MSPRSTPEFESEKWMTLTQALDHIIRTTKSDRMKHSQSFAGNLQRSVSDHWRCDGLTRSLSHSDTVRL